MSNIYLIIEKLEELLSSSEYTQKQKTFIKKLLDGKENGWRPLIILAENPSNDEIKNIISSIEEEIKSNNTGFFYNTYTKLLYKCLSNFRGMNTHMHLAENLVSTNKFKDFANKFDDIYQKTIEKYNGSIILPVCQGLDVRLGNSNGECHGYFCHWATSILEKKNPFGINMNDPIAFRPIKFDSEIGKKVVEWNHLAIFNKNISHYQRHQPEKIKTELRKFSKFYQSTYTLSKKLLSEVSKYPDRVFELQIYGGMLGFSGHALGFYKTEDQLHFFDSNCMWVSFKRSSDFSLWLSFYFESMGYDKIYNEFNIESYESSSEVQLDFKKKLQVFVKRKDNSKSITEMATNAVALAIVTPIFGSYFFVARPIIHATLNIGKQCKGIVNYLNNDAQTKKLSPFSTKHINQSMDDIDAFNTKSNKIFFIDSTYSIASHLDVDLHNVQQAKKNLKESNNKVTFFKPKHLKSPSAQHTVQLSDTINLNESVITNYF